MRTSRKLYNAYKRAMADVQSLTDKMENSQDVNFKYITLRARNARNAYMGLDSDNSYCATKGYRKDPLVRIKNRIAHINYRNGYTLTLEASSSAGLNRRIRNECAIDNITIQFGYVYADSHSVIYTYNVQ